MIGQTLGAYRVLDKLGEDGMGEVLRRDPTDVVIPTHDNALVLVARPFGFDVRGT